MDILGGFDEGVGRHGHDDGHQYYVRHLDGIEQ